MIGGGLRDLGASVAVAAACAAVFPRAAAFDLPVPRASGLAVRKAPAAPEPTTPLLATLVQTHTPERVPLDADSPTAERFDRLLADRATGSSGALDPRLIALLRTLAEGFPSADGGAPSIELVSGYRSPKLNEMLRKKGHHVASHSQHSLGHAVDFRIVVPCAPSDAACAGAKAVALDPRVIERAIRAAGWEGGVGTYTGKDDWFVHADVGPRRSWFEGPRTAEASLPRN